jgi:protein-S-isoprenylcysteine O-methyltransferase Ste14
MAILKPMVGTPIRRLVLGAAVFGVWSIWSASRPGGGTTAPDISKAISMSSFAALVVLRGWFVLRVSGTTVKKRYVRLDLPMAVAQIGLLLPVVWAASPLLDFATYTSGSGPLLVGTVCYVFGLLICYRSHADLGKGLSSTLDIKEGHRLVTSGIYDHIRHPMYLGFLVFTLGQALVVRNVVAGLSGVVGILLLVGFRVSREERMMLDEFGDEYVAYRERTKRLIPGVW